MPSPRSNSRFVQVQKYRTWRKVVERIALSVVVILAAAMAGSSAYNTIALHIFWAQNAPPGAFYSVNGHRMHLNCTGSGSPTIVLESGSGKRRAHLGRRAAVALPHHSRLLI